MRLNNKIMSEVVSVIRIVIVSSITVFAISTVSAWTSPTSVAPAGNVAGPVTTSATAQTKAGAFTASGLTSTNRLTVGEAGGAYTYITLMDDESPNGVKYVHANSNVIGFLSGAGSWLSYWDNGGSQRNTGVIYAPDVCTSDGRRCLSMLTAVPITKTFSANCGPVKAPSNSGSCSPYGDTAIGYCVREGFTAVVSKDIQRTAGDIIDGMGMNADGTNYAARWGGGNSMVSVTCTK